MPKKYEPKYYDTLEELVDAIKEGELPADATLTIDNDETSMYVDVGPNDYQCVFRMHPGELTEQALDLLGVRHEGV